MNILQQLAEKEYEMPRFNMLVRTSQAKIAEKERTAFIKGLQMGMEFAEWLNKQHGELKTTEELLEIFLKDRYGK